MPTPKARFSIMLSKGTRYRITGCKSDETNDQMIFYLTDFWNSSPIYFRNPNHHDHEQHLKWCFILNINSKSDQQIKLL